MQENQSSPSSVYDKVFAYFFALTAVSALVIVRLALFYNEWGDYSYFLVHWVAEFREMSFWEGLGTKVGNYNHPYMYFLNIIARINLSDLYLIKIFSVLFDFLLAFFVMKIVSLKTESLNMRILAFLLTFAIPTVVINSAMWAQCDAIYSAFTIGAVYFALCGRSKLSYVFLALGFAFKLQAMFLLPLFAVFVLLKKISLKDCWLFFVVLFATFIPAIVAGMSFNDLFSVYVNQVNSYSALNMNIANAWRFVGYVDFDAFYLAGLYVTGVVVLGLLYFTYVHKERLKENVDFIRLTYLFAVIMPFLLPKMHDRYYFLADVLSVVVFMFDKRRWFVPIVTIFVSYLGYAWLMMGGFVAFDFKFGALAMLFVIIVVLRDYVLSLRKEMCQ